MKKNLPYFVSRLLPDRIFIPLHFIYATKKIPNLNNPKTFSEKIQWIKLYGGLDELSQYVDKIKVRDYVIRKIGKKYLIPVIGTWDTFEEIPFKKLPKKYILKATHGSGYNFICLDNSRVKKSALKKIVSGWMNDNYYKWFREAQYKNLVPRIICQKYIEDGSGALLDYKFFCFNGKAKLIQVDSDRYLGHKRDLFDINWKKLPIVLQHPNSKKPIVKPKKLTEMIWIAEKLSKKFNFARVDLYYVKGRIYFGELTFTPGDGVEKFTPSIADTQIGRLLDLSNFRNH